MQSKISSSFLCIGLVASFVFADTNSTNSSEPNSAKQLGGRLLRAMNLVLSRLQHPIRLILILLLCISVQRI